jgi:hypothetical protein
MTIKYMLNVLAVMGSAAMATLPAHATDDVGDTERLQRQLDSLQRQMRSLQRQIGETKKPAQQAPASAAPSPDAGSAESQIVAAGPIARADAFDHAATANVPRPAKAPWAPLPPSIKLTWGGYVEAAGIWRNRNEVADVNSDFNNVPYQLSPLNHEHELRFSARQSRLFFDIDGRISTSQLIKAYFEMDFLGAATTANSIESNSYTPRIRHAFLSYDDTFNGWHILAGQTWSLLTQNKTGIVPREENRPDIIDAQYVVGFNWTRNPQLRVVKDFDQMVWVGVSVESPQVRFQAPGSGTPNGLFINSSNTGTQSGLMDTLQSYSIDTIPDFVEKIALDPGWGHYEVVGLQRFFTDRVQQCTIATTACAIGTSNAPTRPASNDTTFGWGAGGSVILPVVPKFLDLQGSVLYGQGIGRYGSAQLPDVTFARNGSLAPITAFQALVGALFHINPDLDVYAFAGIEQDKANYSTVRTNAIGLGNPLYADGLCFTENSVAAPGAPTSPVSGVLSNTGCSVNVKQVEEITVGFWHNLYRGPIGRLVAGMEFEYLHRTAFSGLNFVGSASATTIAPVVAPAVDEATVMSSLRFYF